MLKPQARREAAPWRVLDRCTTASCSGASTEEKTSGGIIIPDTAKEKPIEGEVLAVGPGARDETGRIIPLDVRAGDRVLFGKWPGPEVLIDGETRLIRKKSDILGRIEGKSRATVRAA